MEACQNIGYSTTCFPNAVGYYTQAGTQRVFDVIEHLLGCTPKMKEYLCAILVPKCHPIKGPHFPCPSFTDYILKMLKNSSECESFDIFNIKELRLVQGKLPTNDSYCYAPQIHGEL